MPHKRSLDLRPVRVGPISIPLYRYADGRTVFSDKFGGPRKIRSFANEERARAEAEVVALRALRGETIRHELRQSDFDAYRRAAQICAPFSTPITCALEEWAQARRACGRDRCSMQRSGVEMLSRPSKTCSEVIEALLAAKRMAGVSAIYLDKLAEDLTSFAADLGGEPIGGISTDQMQTWLASRPVGPRRRNNLRAALVTTFRFAQSRKWLAPGPTAPQLFDKAKERRGAVTVYTPAELQFRIANVREEMLPWLVVGTWSGVRTEEIRPGPGSHKDRLRWSDFNWKKGHINVRPKVAKTGERRLVPLLDNLLEWLAPWHGAHGPVIAEGMRTDRESERLCRISKRLTARAIADPTKHFHPCPGLTWRHNALRHSYGSYRMSVIKNAPQVSYEMGNSVP